MRGTQFNKTVKGLDLDKSLNCPPVGGWQPCWGLPVTGAGVVVVVVVGFIHCYLKLGNFYVDYSIEYWLNAREIKWNHKLSTHWKNEFKFTRYQTMVEPLWQYH